MLLFKYGFNRINAQTDMCMKLIYIEFYSRITRDVSLGL